MAILIKRHPLFFISVEIDFNIQTGNQVKVKPGIRTPRHGWQGVSPGTIGIITDIKDDGRIEVDFPDKKGWRGILCEMELATPGS